jgi:hypothetical protein
MQPQGPAVRDDQRDLNHHLRKDSLMSLPLRRCAVAAMVGATLLAPTSPAAAADRVDRGNLLTAAQMAQGSTREGWHVVRDRSGQFDCGTFGVMTSGAADRVRRGFMSDADASGLSYAARFHGRERAQQAYRRVLAAIRTCFGSSGKVRVRADEAVDGPGRIRLVQLFFRTACCGADSHTFAAVLRGNRTAVVKIGEMGKSPVAPMRAVALTAAEQLSR